MLVVQVDLSEKLVRTFLQCGREVVVGKIGGIYLTQWEVGVKGGGSKNIKTLVCLSY